MTLRGIVALSPWKICKINQAIIETPKQTKVTMTRGLLHEYSRPPHWSASKKQIIDGIMMAVPIGSNRMKISHRVLFSNSGDDFPTELGRKIVTIASTTPPIGRLTASGVSMKLDDKHFEAYCKSTISKWPDLWKHHLRTAIQHQSSVGL